MSVKGQDERWTLCVCGECDWTSSTYPPRALCCSTKPHESSLMHAVEVVPKSRLDAALVGSEARERELTSLYNELSVICGGPGEPREGETKAAYWLRRVTEAVAAPEAREAVLVEALKEVADVHHGETGLLYGDDEGGRVLAIVRKALAGVVEAEPVDPNCSKSVQAFGTSVESVPTSTDGRGHR